MKKKSLKVILGVTLGFLLVGATWGCLYAMNSSVRNWVDNAVNKVKKDVPEEFKNVLVDSTLELTANEIKTQGLQSKDKVDPSFNLKFALKNLPKDFKGDDTLVTKVVTGNQDDVYFTSGANKYYNSITHENGEAFTFARKAFDKSGKTEKFLIKTYWAAYPDIFLNSELVFKSDFKATIGEPMAIVDAANLTDSFKAQQGIQIYQDDPAVTLIAPTLKNKTDKISNNPLIGHKVMYGNADLITFGNVLGDNDGPIGLTKSGETLVISHDAFEETDQVENYVIRSYLVEDESVYLDSRISFKSDFEENDVRDNTPYSIEFSMVSQDQELDEWQAEQDKTCEVEIGFTSSVNKVTYVRIVSPEGNHTPVIKIGAKTYKNGVVEVENGDQITIKLDDIKNDKDYTYYIDYVCLQETSKVNREEITVHGYHSNSNSSSNPTSGNQEE